MARLACVLMLAMLVVPLSTLAAEDRASASIRNISFQLIDLDPLDAFAPGIAVSTPCGFAGGPHIACNGPEWRTSDRVGIFLEPTTRANPLGLPTYTSVSPHREVLISPGDILVSATWSGTSETYGSSVDLKWLLEWSSDYSEEGVFDTDPGLSLSPHTRFVFSGDVELSARDSCQSSSFLCRARSSAFISASGLPPAQSFRLDTRAGDAESLRQHIDYVVESGADGLQFEFLIRLEATGAHPVTPVPEPGQWALILCGLFSISLARRLRVARN